MDTTTYDAIIHDWKSGKYQSSFSRWDEDSWVRSKASRTTPFDPDLLFFSPSLSSLFTHPAVSSAPQEIQRSLLVHQLYVYLEFTVYLELGPVNEICAMLQSPDFLPWLPDDMKSDARSIYTDEAGHAKFSADLIKRVEQATGISCLDLRPQFLDVLRTLITREEPEYEGLLKLFFVIISETLITGTLKKLPADERVQVAVRDTVRDHAHDEAKHHAYFSSVFEFIWPKFPMALKTYIARILPEMILAFLSPDESALKAIISQFDYFERADAIASAIVKSDETLKGIGVSARPTLKMLKKSGVFEDSSVRRAFEAVGLVIP